VPDAPVGTPKTINPGLDTTLLEDGSYTFTPTDFGFTDPHDAVAGGGPVNSFKGVEITTLPTNGTFKLGGATFAAGTMIAIDGAGNIVG